MKENLITTKTTTGLPMDIRQSAQLGVTSGLPRHNSWHCCIPQVTDLQFTREIKSAIQLFTNSVNDRSNTSRRFSTTLQRESNKWKQINLRTYYSIFLHNNRFHPGRRCVNTNVAGYHRWWFFWRRATTCSHHHTGRTRGHHTRECNSGYDSLLDTPCTGQSNITKNTTQEKETTQKQKEKTKL